MTAATVTPIRASKRRTAKAAHSSPLPPAPAESYGPDSVPIPTETLSRLEDIAVDSIDRDPNNRPCVLDAELVDSIRELGVLQPILVRSIGNDRYQVIAGERRWAASVEAGRVTIPAVVTHMTDEQAAVAQAVENLRRRDLAPTEECRAVVRCTTLGLTVDDIAARLGATPSWVKLRVAALSLPPQFLDGLDAHRLGWDDIASAAALPPDIVTRLSPSRHAIADAVALERRRKEANKRIKQLEKKGTVVVGADVGVRVSEAVGWDNDGKHETEPCHAIRVVPEYWGVRETAVCTEPKRHDPTGPSTLKRPTRQSGASNLGAERHKARVASLVEWAKPYLTWYKIEPADVELLMVELIDRRHYVDSDVLDVALRILNIKPGKLSVADKTKALVDYATTRSTNTWVALLLWVSAAAGNEYRGNPVAHKWCTDHGWTDPHPPDTHNHDPDDDQGDDDLDEYGEQLSIEHADA